MTSRVPLPVLPPSIRWAFVLAVAAVIFNYSVLAVAPEHPSPGTTSGPEFRHFLAYFAFGLTLAYATVTRPESRGIRALFVFATVAVFGAFVEIVQAFTPGRMLALTDIAINAVAGLTSTVWFTYERHSRSIDVRETFATWLGQDSD